MNIAWATDVHFDHVRNKPERFAEFCKLVRMQSPDMLVLTGDIGVADSLIQWLGRLIDELQIPVRFVLGNHDFWGSSFSHVRTISRSLRSSFGVPYLHGKQPEKLTDEVYLIGEDGWYGMHIEDLAEVDCLMNDWQFIEDFIKLEHDMNKVQALSKKLEGEAALVLHHKLEYCFNQLGAGEVILATHVPPFEEASLYNGKPGSKNISLFSAPVVGQRLLEVMQTWSDRKLTVLCGHSHDACDYKPLPNLQVYVGGAQYGHPRPQTVQLVR
jgi:3',5'-cyclic-AMP phosphodiesterase